MMSNLPRVCFSNFGRLKWLRVPKNDVNCHKLLYVCTTVLCFMCHCTDSVLLSFPDDTQLIYVLE